MSDTESVSSSGSSASSSASSGSSSSSSSEEPLFKYSRISKFPRTFFGKDPVSACLVGSSIFAIGTHSGVLHLAKPNLDPIRTTRIHRASISAIDTDGQYVATASIDGTVVISSISDPQDVQAINLMRPVRAIALDPQYTQSKTYMSGGTSGAATLSSRGWIKSRSDTILEQTSGSILSMCWRDTRAIWCSDDGITVYDTATQTILNKIPLETTRAETTRAETARADAFKPTISVSDTMALVAWAQTIWTLDLVQGKPVRQIELEWTVAGAAPFDDTHFLLLCVESGSPPELRVVDLQGKEIYVDEVSMQGYERLGVNDYHLQGTGTLDKGASNDPLSSDHSHPWYIISATDAIGMKLRDSKDHIDWLMEEGQFDEAYAQSAGVLDESERTKLGKKAADILVAQDRWEEAAQVLAQCLEPNGWKDYWIPKFFDTNHQIELGKAIPQVDLGCSAHTDILVWCLENNSRQPLEDFLMEWDVALFDKSRIIRLLERRKDRWHRTILAKLYLRLSEPYNAAKCYLWSNDSKAFEVVTKYHLWVSMLQDLEKVLMCGLDGGLEESRNMNGKETRDAGNDDSPKDSYPNPTDQILDPPDPSSAPIVSRVHELVKARLELIPPKVVAQLKDSYLVFLYLQQLAAVDEFLVKDFGDLMVKLYAQHDPQRLLSFLMLNGTYNLNAAISVCEKNKAHTNELIYLYGQVGKTHEALDLIINQGDAQRAVEFAVSHKDDELWDYLISYSRDKPKFVIELLRCPQVAPARVLEAVPHTLKIPGLRAVLYDVLRGQKAVLFLNEGALQIVKAEAKDHQTSLQVARLEGHSVDLEGRDDQVDWSEPVLLGPMGPQVVPVYGKISASWLSHKIHHLAEALRYVNATY